MITRFSVSNYRALREVSCPLGRFTVVAGPNGCGKSTLLEALERTASLRSVNGVSSPWESEVEPSSQATMEITARDGREPWQRVWVAPPPQSGAARLMALWVHGASHADEGSALHDSTAPAVVASARLEQGALRAPSPLAERVELLSPTGVGLAGLLADWKLGDDPRLAALLEQLRQVIPQVRSVLPRRTERGYELSLAIGPEARVVPARHASSGTLRVLALLTLLQSLAGRSALVLIDDLDQDLHPRAQAELVAVLRRLLAASPELQIVATSHSPRLLDHVPPAEVRFMAVDEHGVGRIGSLTEHPEWEQRRRGGMRPGEFWSLVGEDWVARSSLDETTR